MKQKKNLNNIFYIFFQLIAFDYIKSNKGISYEDDYPYTSGSSGKVSLIINNLNSLIINMIIFESGVVNVIAKEKN